MLMTLESHEEYRGEIPEKIDNIYESSMSTPYHCCLYKTFHIFCSSFLKKRFQEIASNMGQCKIMEAWQKQDIIPTPPLGLMISHAIVSMVSLNDMY